MSDRNRRSTKGKFSISARAFSALLSKRFSIGRSKRRGGSGLEVALRALPWNVSQFLHWRVLALTAIALSLLSVLYLVGLYFLFRKDGLDRVLAVPCARHAAELLRSSV